MQTILSTDETREKSSVLHSVDAPSTAALPRVARHPRTPSSDLDSLLKKGATVRYAPEVQIDFEPESGPGIVMALRVAILFNAGLGLAGLVAWEAWQMLAH